MLLRRRVLFCVPRSCSNLVNWMCSFSTRIEAISNEIEGLPSSIGGGGVRPAPNDAWSSEINCFRNVIESPETTFSGLLYLDYLLVVAENDGASVGMMPARVTWVWSPPMALRSGLRVPSAVDITSSGIVGWTKWVSYSSAIADQFGLHNQPLKLSVNNESMDIKRSPCKVKFLRLTTWLIFWWSNPQKEARRAVFLQAGGDVHTSVKI